VGPEEGEYLARADLQIDARDRLDTVEEAVVAALTGFYRDEHDLIADAITQAPPATDQPAGSGAGSGWPSNHTLPDRRRCGSCNDQFGGAKGTRTPGLLDANQTLFQLSYSPEMSFAKGTCCPPVRACP
jgi:hypothetical protein